MSKKDRIYQFVIWIIAILLAGCDDNGTIPPEPNEPPTGYTVPDEYATIREALASDEPVITVGPGVYRESVSINRPVKLIGDGTVLDGTTRTDTTDPDTALATLIFDADGKPLDLCAWPDQPPGLPYDRVSDYLPLSDSRNWGQTQRIYHDQVPAGLAGYVKVWSHSANNVILTARIATSAEGVIELSQPLSHPLTNSGSKPDAFSVVNDPWCKTTSREYYVGPDGRIDCDYQTYVSTRAIGIHIAAADVMIDGFEIRNFAGSGHVGGIIANQGPRNLTIRNCNVHDVKGYAGIWISRAADNQIERCAVNNVSGGFGIFVNAGATRCAVRDCNVAGSERTGIYFAGVSDSQIVGNTVGRGGTHQNAIATYQGCNRILIARNQVVNGIRGLTWSSSSDIVVVDNAMHAVGSPAYASWGGCSGTIWVYGNTLVGNYLMSKAGPVWKVQGNIFYRTTASSGHNVVMRSPGPNDILEPDAVKIFVDPDAHNYHLTDGSPAIGAAGRIDYSDVQALFPDYPFGCDITGQPRDSQPDCGAYENP